MNEQQIELGEEILRRLVECNQEVHSSDLFDTFEEFKYGAASLVTKLLDDHQLVEVTDSNYKGYNIRITVLGLRASKIGLKKYLENELEKERLDLLHKKTTIESSIKGNRLALLAIFVSVIFSADKIAGAYSTLANQGGNSAQHSNNKRDDRQSEGELRINPELIQTIRDSLLHDSIFIYNLQNTPLTDEN